MTTDATGVRVVDQARRDLDAFPLPASGEERECTEIAARLVDHSNAGRVGRHESD
ncbi:MAG TPA: hypothetical protein VFV12_14375 [Xanthobacteraceae bacterium]|nr:hypothetical protein [Xanthobacteraceae bacterium]